MRRLIWLRDAAPVLLVDGLGLAGAAAFTFGVWQIYRPAAWIVGGSFALIGAWRLAGPEAAGSAEP